MAHFTKPLCISLKGQESGNVLFLILIAVALFAALSYAVTMTTRDGGGTSNSEGNVVNAAQLNQYPAVVGSTLLRMRVNGIDPVDFEFNTPSQFGTLTDPKFGVFHPATVGTPYQLAPATLMANDQQGKWYYNGHFEVESLGESIAGNFAGNDIIAFLPGIKQSVCQEMNKKLHIDGIPVVNNAAYFTNAMEYMDNAYSPPSSETIIGPTGVSSLTALDARPYGCYRETASSNSYIYYHVILER